LIHFYKRINNTIVYEENASIQDQGEMGQGDFPGH